MQIAKFLRWVTIERAFTNPVEASDFAISLWDAGWTVSIRKTRPTGRFQPMYFVTGRA